MDNNGIPNSPGLSTFTSASPSASKRPQLDLPKDPNFKFSKGTFTALRLYHGSEKDIDRQTRVLFIGPIPQYWLKRNKKSWGRRLVKTAFLDKRKTRSSAQTALFHAGTSKNKAYTDVDAINEQALDVLGTADLDSIRDMDSLIGSMELEFEEENDNTMPNGTTTTTEEDIMNDSAQLMDFVEPISVLGPSSPEQQSVPEPDYIDEPDHHETGSLGSNSGAGIMLPANSPHRSHSLLIKRGQSEATAVATTTAALPLPEEQIGTESSNAESLNAESMSDSSFFTAREDIANSTRGITARGSNLSLSQDSTYKTAIGVDAAIEDRPPPVETVNHALTLPNQTNQSLVPAPELTSELDSDSASTSDADSTDSATTVRPRVVLPQIAANNAGSSSPVTTRDYLSDVLDRNDLHSRPRVTKNDEGGSSGAQKIPSTVPYYSKVAPRRKPETKRASVRFSTAAYQHAKHGGTAVLKSSIRHPHQVAEHWRHTVKDKATIISTRKFLRSKKKGEIVMLEKMLVMIKKTDNDSLPGNFNEIETCDTRVLERWREYIVVARNTGNTEAPILIQFYNKRQVERIQSDNSPKSQYDVVLGKDYGVNLYSSLDKSLALWCRIRGKTGSHIYLFCTKSQETALQWLAFFSGIIGLRQSSVFKVGIPDIGVNLDVDLPFQLLRKLIDAASNDDNLVTYDDVTKFGSAPNKLLSYIVDNCISNILRTKSTHDSMFSLWQSKDFKIGLAWRRYDRIEWIFDNHDIHIQTGWAMMRTHDLELRPKIAFSKPVLVPAELAEQIPTADKLLNEPPSIEGFLTRTSSWVGAKRKKMFSPQMYWYTNNGLLFYCNPFKALPPHPSLADSNLLRKQNDEDATLYLNQKNSNIPLCYEVAPFQLNENGKIAFLAAENLENFLIHDRAASNEANRRVDLISKSAGVIDLTDVDTIKECSSASNEPSETSFPSNFPSLEFDLVFSRGDQSVVLRLRAANKNCRDMWVSRLNQLIVYWKLRAKQDLERRLTFRQKNLDILNIDEDTEAFIGEVSSKWELDRAVADPFLYNIDMHTWGRALQMQGELFQKASKHSSFKKYFVALTQTDLILYVNQREFTTRSALSTLDDNDQYRTSTAAVNYEKATTVPLADCYVYSGPITSLDLVNRARWFDKEHPGHHALPRAYSDGWKSSEEEALRCFVLWFGRKRPIKEKSGDATISFTNRLGVRGTSMVFMTRSRQDRERWVTALKIVTNRTSDSFTSSDIRID